MNLVRALLLDNHESLTIDLAQCLGDLRAEVDHTRRDAAGHHSLAAERTTIPDVLEASAFAPDGTILRVRHTALPRHGVQFHPESILTPSGTRLFGNFLSPAGAAARWSA